MTSVSLRGSVGSVAVANPVEIDSNLFVMDGKSIPRDPSKIAALTSCEPTSRLVFAKSC